MTTRSSKDDPPAREWPFEKSLAQAIPPTDGIRTKNPANQADAYRQSHQMHTCTGGGEGSAMRTCRNHSEHPEPGGAGPMGRRLAPTWHDAALSLPEYTRVLLSNMISSAMRCCTASSATASG